MNLKDSKQVARDRDARLYAEPLVLPIQPIDLLRNLRLTLRQAFDIGKIKTNPNSIEQLVKQDTRESQNKIYVITGGQRKGDNRLLLNNGARLNFMIAVRSVVTGIEVISFSFHLEEPANRTPRLVRYDYLDAQHEDPVKEPRCHLHPGHNDVRLPAPLLTPVEMLHVLLQAMDYKRAHRAKQKT